MIIIKIIRLMRIYIQNVEFDIIYIECNYKIHNIPKCSLSILWNQWGNMTACNTLNRLEENIWGIQEILLVYRETPGSGPIKTVIVHITLLHISFVTSHIILCATFLAQTICLGNVWWKLGIYLMLICL